MNDDYTHITIILDRTGSMKSIRDDTIGGFNAFLEAQKRLPGKATLTLVQFDSYDAYEVIHNFAPIDQIPPLTRDTYKPRSSTPLMDSMGRGIRELDKAIKKMPEKERPGKVIFVTVTDGQDNDSCCFHKMSLCKWIAEKTYKDIWQFVFLSADLEAIYDAWDYGISSDSTLGFDHTPDGTTGAWEALSDQTQFYRTNAVDSMSFGEKNSTAGKDTK